MQESPTSEQLLRATGDATERVDKSRAMRKRLRRRRTPRRDQELRDMLESLAAAAAPVRRYIGMVLAHDIPMETELALKRASQDLRYERRQIGKML